MYSGGPFGKKAIPRLEGSSPLDTSWNVARNRSRVLAGHLKSPYDSPRNHARKRLYQGSGSSGSRAIELGCVGANQSVSS